MHYANWDIGNRVFLGFSHGLTVAADQDHGQLSIFLLGEWSIYNMIIIGSFSLLNALS